MRKKKPPIAHKPLRYVFKFADGTTEPVPYPKVKKQLDDELNAMLNSGDPALAEEGWKIDAANRQAEVDRAEKRRGANSGGTKKTEGDSTECQLKELLDHPDVRGTLGLPGLAGRVARRAGKEGTRWDTDDGTFSERQINRKLKKLRELGHIPVADKKSNRR